KSSNRSSNGEPSGTFGNGVPSGDFRVWDVEMLTTESISSSAVSATDWGPRASESPASDSRARQKTKPAIARDAKLVSLNCARAAITHVLSTSMPTTRRLATVRGGSLPLSFDPRRLSDANGSTAHQPDDEHTGRHGRRACRSQCLRRGLRCRMEQAHREIGR